MPRCMRFAPLPRVLGGGCSRWAAGWPIGSGLVAACAGELLSAGLDFCGTVQYFSLELSRWQCAQAHALHLLEVGQQSVIHHTFKSSLGRFQLQYLPMVRDRQRLNGQFQNLPALLLPKCWVAG